MRYAIPLVLLLAMACVRQTPLPENDHLPKAVKSIAVLPAGVMSESSAPPPSPQAVKEMEEGITVLNQILADSLTANPKIRLLSAEEINAYSLSYSASPAAQTLEIGKAVGAEAVMLWGLERYKERSGGDLGVQTPASVAFQYRLIHTGSGQTLCSASFEETQQPGSNNLLAFNTMAKRGFKWVSAAVLLQEGVSKKLADCQYLATASGREDENHPGADKASSDSTALAVIPPAIPEQSPPPAPPDELRPPEAPSSQPTTTVPATLNYPPGAPAEEISRFLDEWRKAWQATAGPQGDIEHYGAFYAADFKSGKQDRNQWLADKARKNHGKEWIRLKISGMKIFKLENSSLLEARFVQEYTSSNYSETSQKTLFIRNNENNWEIVAEH